MDLWGTISSGNNTDNVAVVPLSSSAVAGPATPSSLIENDIDHEAVISKMIPKLVLIFEWSNALCDASWELSNYVPPNVSSNPDRERLWSKMLIPKIVQALVDDCRSRNEQERAFAAITSLAIAINEGASLIREAKGSVKSIEIARKTIQGRMNELDSCIESLKHLSNAAIELFANHTKEILTIVGPSAATFASQEAECQDVIDREEARARRLIENRAEVVSRVEKYNSLVHCQQTHVYGAAQALTQTQQRTQDLNNLIQGGEKAINAIPDTVTQVTHHQTTTRQRGRGFFGWLFGVHRTTTNNYTTTQQVANPNKQAQVDYYTGVINARNARLQQSTSMEGSARTLLQAQQQDLAEYQQHLKAAQEALQGIDSRITVELTQIQQAIDTQLKKIKEIRAEADRTENLLGMKGSILIQCLTAIRNFSKAEKDTTCLFQPLVSVLQHVKDLTTASVDMLDGDRTEVFVGGVRLLKYVGFFVTTSATLRTLAAPSEERQLLLDRVREQNRITN